ncbi:MAG: class I SAM-dependent methyltransferase [Clostridiales Family XIII bacterium]|jgi:tRNA (adenine22-N1)-methyltransferase|nr:class I SAM-dependent methyltransferase [Clostridiales Family XIII bacterium]
MTRLSERLERICAEIRRGERVADIGTDHGLLPVALYERGLASALILSDLRQGPMDKARANIGRLLPGVEFDMRLGDGLSALQSGEADAVVMAGMGGRLIAGMLASDPEKARSMGRYILQPRNAAETLRRWLADNGFGIAGEALAREGRFICEIITALPRDVARRPPRDCAGAAGLIVKNGLEFEISPMLAQGGDPLLAEWLGRKIATEMKTLAGLRMAKGGGGDREAASVSRLRALKELLEAL